MLSNVLVSTHLGPFAHDPKVIRGVSVRQLVGGNDDALGCHGELAVALRTSGLAFRFAALAPSLAAFSFLIFGVRCRGDRVLSCSVFVRRGANQLVGVLSASVRERS
jgi:hypothetical protein